MSSVPSLLNLHSILDHCNHSLVYTPAQCPSHICRLTWQNPNLVKCTSLPALYLQLNCGWRKIQNHVIWSHFKFMTASHKWILGVVWQPNYFPTHSLSNSCGRPCHIYSFLLKPPTPLLPFSLSVNDLVSYFIEKIEVSRREKELPKAPKPNLLLWKMYVFSLRAAISIPH